MKRKTEWKKYITYVMTLALLIVGIVGIGNMRAQTAEKTIRSLKIMQAGKNLTKKTLQMSAGSSKKLVIKAKTSLSKKNIKYKSSDNTVVTVDKNGRLQANKIGFARITVTVSKKGYKTKKIWMQVSVENDNMPNPTETPIVVPTVEPIIEPTVEPIVEPTSTPKSDALQNPDTSTDNGKILVAYFSWSGTSERIAQNIISQTGADSFRIERETPYSDDYSTVAYGEAKDEADANARPPIKNPLDSLEQYDKIVLCYPIWWHTAPMTVGTFLEHYDMTGKTIYPISQSASMDTSQYDQSVAFIKECAKGATVDDGLFTKNNDTIQEYIENTVLN